MGGDGGGERDRIDRRGPKTEPSGTPLVAAELSDLHLIILDQLCPVREDGHEPLM